MAEYIEREAFIAEKREYFCMDCNKRKGIKGGKVQFCYDIGDAPCRSCDVEDMLDYIDSFPAADVRPVVHAEWICICRNLDGTSDFECSACLGILMDVPDDDEHDLCTFCPNCGADMREADDED